MYAVPKGSQTYMGLASLFGIISSLLPANS